MLRCECCSSAFCEDHMPVNCGMLGECERFKALGQHHPQQAYFIRCSPECEKFGAEEMAEFVELAVAQTSDGAGNATAAAAQRYKFPDDDDVCLYPAVPAGGSKKPAPAIYLPDASPSVLLSYVKTE